MCNSQEVEERTNEWINKIQYIQATEYYLDLKVSTELIHTTECTQPEDVMRGEEARHETVMFVWIHLHEMSK